MSSDKYPKIILRQGNGIEKTFILDKEIITIGRNEPSEGIYNDISIDDLTVSRRHARISRTSEGYLIEDLQSNNGTYVNNVKIKKAILKNGDFITIGTNVLAYLDESSPPTKWLEMQLPEPKATINLEYIILQSMAFTINTATEFDILYEKATEILKLLIPAERGLILLGNLDKDLRCVSSWGKDLNYSKSLVRLALTERKAIVTGEEISPSDSAIERGVYSIMCAPIFKENKPIGIIYMEDSMPNRFAEGHLILLNIVANQIALGIERIGLNQKIKEEVLIRSSLERFFSPPLVTKILNETLKGGGLIFLPVRTNATIMFLDIVGSTKLIEYLSPLEILELLNKYFELMVEEIFTNGGVLDKYLGDGLMAIFGVPENYHDHTYRAVLSAINMRRRHFSFVNELPIHKRFDIRIGIESGEIVSGYFGSHKRLEFTALGKTVVMAKRLESLASPNSIYIGKGAYLNLGGDFKVIPLGKKRIPKGEQDIEVYEIIE
jgi:adenylate cyclase